jgi:hypothetical protein
MMKAAFEPFKEYVQWLAEGKLDSYLNSICPEDKEEVPNVDVPKDLSLLLHDIGKHPDVERIEKLFVNGTVCVFPHPACMGHGSI